MATLFKKPGSRFWYTAYFDAEGKRIYKSTKKLTRSDAAGTAAELERRARRMTSADTENGRRLLAILEEAGEIAMRSALTETAAREYLNRILEVSTGGRVYTPSIQEWFAEWLASKRLSRSSGTVVRYEGVVDDFLKFLTPLRCSQPLGTLSITDVRRFRDFLLSGGRIETTANIALKVLRSCLSTARKQGLIPINPAEAVELVACQPAEKGVFSPQDVARLLKHSSEEWTGLILAGYYTGARLGDLASLHWKSIDLDRGAVSITQRKTGKAIEIPLHPELMKWLVARKPADSGSMPVFPKSSSRVIGGRNGLSGQFKLIMKNAGIAGAVLERRGKKGRNRNSLSFHSLRHSFNSALANAGVPQEIRQRLTGHASKDVNDRYTHTELETIRAAVSLLSALPSREAS